MKDCNAEKYSYSCLFAAVFRPWNACHFRVPGAVLGSNHSMGIAFRLHRLPDWQHWNRKKLPHRKNATVTDHWCPTVTGKEWLAWPCAIQFARCKARPSWHWWVVQLFRGNAASERGEPERKRVVYTAQSIDKAAKVAANLPNRRVLLIMIGKT